MCHSKVKFNKSYKLTSYKNVSKLKVSLRFLNIILKTMEKYKYTYIKKQTRSKLLATAIIAVYLAGVITMVIINNT